MTKFRDQKAYSIKFLPSSGLERMPCTIIIDGPFFYLFCYKFVALSSHRMPCVVSTLTIFFFFLSKEKFIYQYLPKKINKETFFITTQGPYVTSIQSGMSNSKDVNIKDPPWIFFFFFISGKSRDLNLQEEVLHIYTLLD